MRRALLIVLMVVAGLVPATGWAAARPAAEPAPTSAPAPAPTPPMGWNDWYAFFCDLDESLVEQTADAIVSSGMKAAGYRYVNLDDCWASHDRDAAGNLQADPVKFPHGIKAVADYVHARGLELGIYEDVGTKTCAGYPGSYGHVQQDADTFASWGVDFVKVDWCNVPFADFPGLTQQQVAIQLYTAYSEALKATGRPMVFSICEWNPKLEPWTWAPAISNLWRTNNDYGDTWRQVLANLDQEAPLAPYAGPDHWNDPDILQVGLGGANGLGPDGDRAHFTMWAMLSAPLLAGNDLRSMSADTKATLTNREVIALDQDPLGAQATRLTRDGDADVWVKRLANGDRAVMLLNRGDTPRDIATTARAAGLGRSGAYTLRDLWAHRTTETAGRIAASVPAHGAVVYRVAPLRDGEVGDYPPATDVEVTADVPPVAAGSEFRLARPGQVVPVTATFHDGGRQATHDVRLALAAPPGWSVRTVGSGRWEVTVPAGAAAGEYPLTATATYRWDDHRGSVTGQSGIAVAVPPAGTPYLSDLAWLSADNGYGPVKIDTNYYGDPLTVHGVTYPHGLWTNAVASLQYYVGGGCSRFTVDVGIDDSTQGRGSVVFQVYADGVQVADSGTVRGGAAAVHLDVPVTGAQVLRLAVGDAGDGISYDNADWGSPLLTCSA
ncbi:MAG: NPCBM/NEW2 domain-containing protein [Mycobacteriales bacterium]